MLVALQLDTVADVPLNFTVPEPWLLPKFVPVIVTEAPTAPLVSDKLEMLGVGRTVKETPLLLLLETVTTTFPVVAPVGTVATMLDALQLVMEAVVPLNLTVLEPCEFPKLEPAIVTDAPTAPDVGVKLDMEGDAAWTSAARAKDKIAITTTKTDLHPRIIFGLQDTYQINGRSFQTASRACSERFQGFV